MGKEFNDIVETISLKMISSKKKPNLQPQSMSLSSNDSITNFLEQMIILCLICFFYFR